MANQDSTLSPSLNWKPYRQGATLGELGSEQGTIIQDEEYLGQARITIEKQARQIPFAITLGVYDLFVHTCYAGSAERIHTMATELKIRLEEIVNLDTAEGGNQKVDQLADKLIHLYP